MRAALEKATMLSRGGDHVGALNILFGILDTEQQHQDVLCAIAFCARNINAREMSLHYFSLAYKQSKNINTALQIAIDARVLGHIELAESWLKNILENNPRYIQANYEMGILAERRGQMQEAKFYYLNALKIMPQHKGSIKRLFEIYMDMGDLIAAESLAGDVRNIGEASLYHSYKSRIQLRHGKRTAALVHSILQARIANDIRAYGDAFALAALTERNKLAKLVLHKIDSVRHGKPFEEDVARKIGFGIIMQRNPLSHTAETLRDIENGRRWISNERLPAVLQAAIDEARPFAAVRLGDGEGSFLSYFDTEKRDAAESGEDLTSRWRRWEGLAIWRTWFAEDMRQHDPAALGKLKKDFLAAITACDVVGIPTVDRLRVSRNEKNVSGSTRIIEAAQMLSKSDHFPGMFTDANFHSKLEKNRIISNIIRNLPDIGVVTCHTDLPEVLKQSFNFRSVRSHFVPAEKSHEHRFQGSYDNNARHFPDVYRRMLDEIDVPRLGFVYLVGAGLLGKIYCAKIKRLGGIAIDVGSIFDAWLGHDTRGIYHALDRWKLG